MEKCAVSLLNSFQNSENETKNIINKIHHYCQKEMKQPKKTPL